MAIAMRRRQPEKLVQAHVLHLVRSIGGTPYVLGTRRRKGDYPGTMQSAGLGDVFAFLPPTPRTIGDGWTALWIECKAAGGRLSAEQLVFREYCRQASLAHVTGGLDELTVFLIDGGWLKADAVPHYRRPAAAASGDPA